ncbi:DUF2235 domain-containing protein [Actinomycetota bacterium]
MPKNIVICLDGTANEPEREHTNVTRIFDMLEKDPLSQVAYYDPGVGTMGARTATTRAGKALTKVGGLALGHGVKQNIAEAYEWLMNVYEEGDRIFLFGFSRGAYTARALAGLLRTAGLLETGATNLIPYAMKLYTGAPPADGKKPDQMTDKAEKAERNYWDEVQRWENVFGNPHFRRFGKPIHFLGAWDTVKFVGWFNLVGRFRQARWPFTRNLDAVVHGRHAVSIDERRRYYAEYLFDATEIGEPSRDLREVWFAGVHSDVGGGYEDHGLADVTLKWMVDEAIALGMLIRPKKYKSHLGVPVGDPLPASTNAGTLHPNKFVWSLLGLGWRRRKIERGSLVHASVEDRIAMKDVDYRPELNDVTYVDK